MDYRVTNGLLLLGPMGGKDRLVEEARILNQHFPSWRLYKKQAEGLSGVALGTLQVGFAGHEYAVQILLPKIYPENLPAILPKDWTPRANPHLIGEGLCVMRTNQWQSYMTVGFLVAKTALWLNKYEIYLDQGIWPGAEQHAHGLVYRAKKRFRGL